MPPKPAQGRGKPPFLPTTPQRTQCQALVACGVTHETIARYFHISPTTLRKAFRVELDVGRDIIEATASGLLVKKAITDGNLAALIFLLKTKFQWRETNQTQFLGKDGAPISFDRLDTPTLEQVLAALRAGGSGSSGRGAPESEDED